MTEINIKHAFNLAIQYHQKNNLNEAKKIYLQILKINPNHVNAHNNLGAAYKQLGEIEKAKSCFEKVIQLNPNDVDGHNNLGLLLFELKEIQKAKSFFEKTIQLYHDQDEFLMNDRWEEDEYKALEEFCNNFNFSYDVLAVSFYTKQIGVKLKKL